MNHQTIMLVAAVMLAGCTSSSGPAARHEPYVRPGLIMLTPDQAQRYGPTLALPASAISNRTPLDSNAVMVSPTVTVYGLNRTADPSDPEVMHEAHVVYRRGTTPQWRLDAPAEHKILVGPQVTDGRQDLQPVLSKEIAGLLAEERRATEANREAIATLFQAVEALGRQQQSVLRQLSAPGIKPEPPPASPSTPAATAANGS